MLAIAASAGVTVSFSVAHTFDDHDCAFLFGALMQGADGNFYGTSIGEDYNEGTIFKLTPRGKFTVLYTFSGADGGFPESALVQRRDGNFYGTARYGGAYGDGSDGGSPAAGLLRGSAGSSTGQLRMAARSMARSIR